MIDMLIKNNNSIVIRNKDKHLIMQHSSGVDAFRVLVGKEYSLDPNGNKVEMKDFKCVMEYLLPNSKKYQVIELERIIEDEVEVTSNSGADKPQPVPESEMDNYLKFRLPIESDFTKEAGDIEIQFTFARKDDTEGENIIMRKTEKTKITIEPTTEWSNVGIDVFNKELEEILDEEVPSV